MSISQVRDNPLTVRTGATATITATGNLAFSDSDYPDASITYTITTADGKSRQFWERNLRLKTDSSNDGPEKNAPALVEAGMMGDRADVIFADPQEITPMVRAECEGTKP